LIRYRTEKIQSIDWNALSPNDDVPWRYLSTFLFFMQHVSLARAGEMPGRPVRLSGPLKMSVGSQKSLPQHDRCGRPF
jgi:hypothetical protein